MTTTMKKAIHNEEEKDVIAFEELVNELGNSVKNFKIEVKKTVRDILITLDSAEQELLLQAIHKIPERIINSLSDAEGLYSLKVNDFRIIYSASQEVITIIVLKREK